MFIMNVTVLPRAIRGEVQVLASKSITHRAIVLATLTRGVSVISNILNADETEATMGVGKSFGAVITQ